MLPESRQQEYLFNVPKFDLTIEDVEGFWDELEAFHAQFADCFQRVESRKNFLRYMTGQFGRLERKSIEPIAHAVEGGKVRAMQRFVSAAPWDDQKMLARYRSLMVQDLGHPDGILVFDETAFVKKGEDSVGVSRQYCGTLGKVENCQVGVFAAYVSPYGYSFLDKRLYMPKVWFSEEYAERREKCEVPDGLEFKTKARLASDILVETAETNNIPFKYILGDSVYANGNELIEAAESMPNVTYLLQIANDTLCWKNSPHVETKKYKYAGKKRSKKVLGKKSHKPITVKEFAEGINRYFWYRRTVSEGSKGPVEYEYTKHKIILSKNGLPDKNVCLLVRRTLGKEPEYAYYISNPFPSQRLDTLVWLSGQRWAIEQCFGEAKTELGMDHYEVRKFAGWHHHILTCMLAHFFLWHLKIKMGKKSPCPYGLAGQSAFGGCFAGAEHGHPACH